MVRRSLRIFEDGGLPYAIQSTVTRDTVDDMSTIVRHFARHIRPTMVKFEPVSDCGRFQGKPDQIPDGKEFARSFGQADAVAREKGLKLAFSGLRLWGEGVSHFCGAFGEPFAVTPDGRVSACYEAYSEEAPFAEQFLFGRYDEEASRFTFDLNKLERLRRRNVYTLDPCRKCFCKYSCGGDCATRNFRATRSTDLGVVGARCDAIREISRHRLERYLDQSTPPAASERPGDET